MVLEFWGMDISDTKKMVLVTVAAFGLGACSATMPTVPASEPHGVIFTQWHHATDDTHPVMVTNINGVNLRGPFPERITGDPPEVERTVFRAAAGHAHDYVDGRFVRDARAVHALPA